MAPNQHVLLSPAELAYLHEALSLTPPIRPDGRAPTQFRPLVAETEILPGTNGSARICFADGTEAIVGVKAEVERTRGYHGDDEEEGGEEKREQEREGQDEWVELTVEIPGYREDDASTAFLAAMLSEALLADGGFAKKLWINRRFHWKLFLDIILISPPLSYPLPLLSLTTHLALLSTRLPRLKSEGDEDPFFDDDWAAAPYLYPQGTATTRPPITLLVMAVGRNIIFDPTKEELAVADVVLAVSVGEAATDASSTKGKGKAPGRSLRLLSVRTVDPPSRVTPPGVPNATNSAYGIAASAQKQPEARTVEAQAVEGVWRAPRGGAKPAVMAALVQKVLERGGVADEVLDALDAVELG
ncbi:ribosomal protein S5 domain 2-type protein [Lasiosphaeris hirsuta]|uniref:Ribosomal RNA-processing protein 42 n=1 Tax=Lasiosphaeris hirsuta TaxID=260670 RepID=A0AA39ZX83_9PEZI|nr:ribosomal protein S5 domain 2-type protein [Lasiosphaeris hirsuta]